MHGVMRLHSTAAWTEEAEEVRERKAAAVVAMVRRAAFFVVDIFSLSLSETAARGVECILLFEEEEEEEERRTLVVVVAAVVAEEANIISYVYVSNEREKDRSMIYFIMRVNLSK